LELANTTRFTPWRRAAEVQDGVDAFDQLMHGGFVCQITAHHFFVGAGSRCHLADVGQTQDSGVGAQTFAQYLAQPAGSAGQQQAIEGAQFAGDRGHGGAWTLVACCYWFVIRCRMTWADYQHHPR
jgi:hypothetical protein